MQRGRPGVTVLPYRHTQPGTAILVVCLAIGALGAAIILATGQMSMIFMLIVVIAVAIVFYSLTADYVMVWKMLTGKMGDEVARALRKPEAA